MSGYRNSVERLALSIGAGRWDREALIDRLSRALNGGPPDPGRLAARLLFHFEPGSPPPRARLIAFLAQDRQVHQALSRAVSAAEPSILLDEPVMGSPPDGLVTFPLPRLATQKDLRLWLAVSEGELAWFSDLDGRQVKVREPKLHHYRYRWVAKASGTPRLIEIPKSRLKAIQRQILRELLNRVPPHTAAHGFRRHRSCLSHATPHVGKAVLLQMDLKDFFHSVPTARIGAVFRRLGYPQGVARTLQGLCTHAVSPALAGPPFPQLSWDVRRRLRFKHLPQGAPGSPALANLCAWRLDCRLQGLAQRYGLDYTRYADDLAFSGPVELMRLAPFLRGLIGAIALEEGFSINHRKTRLSTQAQCQRLTGVVVNAKANVSRRDFDRLKAILHNCIRYGPESQNRQGLRDFKSHLAGRIAHVNWLNRTKGDRLAALWRHIDWSG